MAFSFEVSRSKCEHRLSRASSADLAKMCCLVLRIKTQEIKHPLAVAKRLIQPTFPITFGFLATLDSHVKRTEMVLQLKIYGPFGSGQNNILHLGSPRNLVDLSDVLTNSSIRKGLNLIRLM
jgi:hypothetical protein